MKMGMNQSIFVFLSEGAALVPALRSLCVPIDLLCVFACEVTIEDTTQTPMWYYTAALRRMGAGKELVIRKRLLKARERSSRFAIPAVSFEVTTINFPRLFSNFAHT
jgi:hypothetical protein